MKDECRKCGQCCFYLHPVTGKLKRCKYLIALRGEPGKSLCGKRIKKNSLRRCGHFMLIEKTPANYDNVFCLPRKFSPWDYPLCPFNTDKKEYPPWQQTLEDYDGTARCMIKRV